MFDLEQVDDDVEFPVDVNAAKLVCFFCSRFVSVTINQEAEWRERDRLSHELFLQRLAEHEKRELERLEVAGQFVSSTTCFVFVLSVIPVLVVFFN